MSRVETFENRVNDLLIQENPTLADMRRVMLEIDDYLNSAEYPSLSVDERSRLQTARKDLKARLRRREDAAARTAARAARTQAPPV
jgi:predicted component of type VI protein secretion system